MLYKIKIKKYKNIWSFYTPSYSNLPKRTLEENSLVLGASSLLEELSTKYKNINIAFSDIPNSVNSAQLIKLTWVKGNRQDPNAGGNWYKTEDDKEIWLCSVLFDYFNPCPLHLYIYILI